MKTMRAEQCRGKGQRAGVRIQFSSWPSSLRSTKKRWSAESLRLARGNPPLRSLVSPAYVAVVVFPLLQRFEQGVDARICAVKALSWWPCHTVERLNGVADAHSMEAQRNRPLDKGGRSCLRP